MVSATAVKNASCLVMRTALPWAVKICLHPRRYRTNTQPRYNYNVTLSLHGTTNGRAEPGTLHNPPFHPTARGEGAYNSIAHRTLICLLLTCSRADCRRPSASSCVTPMNRDTIVAVMINVAFGDTSKAMCDRTGGAVGVMSG